MHLVNMDWLLEKMEREGHKYMCMYVCVCIYVYISFFPNGTILIYNTVPPLPPF